MSMQPATVEELGRFLGRRTNTLYHHLRPLVEVGLVVECGERPTSKRPAKLYRLPANRLEVDPDDRSEEAMLVRRKIIRAVMRTALARQESALDDPDVVFGGRRPSVMSSIRIARLRPRGHERVARVLKELNAILGEEHHPDGRAFVLTYQLSPFDGS